MRTLFVVLSVALLGTIGWAAARDTQSRQYLDVQNQYKNDYPNAKFNVQVQQLFPAFPAATVGGSFRVERCISCHVPDIGVIGPEQAAQRLSQDFFKYEPNAKQIAADDHLTGTHPAYVTTTGGQYPPSISYSQYGADNFHPYQYVSGGKTQTANLAGFLPSFLNPASTSNTGSKEGIDAIGCIVCHNGTRIALDQTDAHVNLIINPVYSFSEGAALYYKTCAVCHGGSGEGGVGPPLSNQDRLGFFNEDYYYRCVEYGLTGFEHRGSVMPNWGSIASDYHYDPAIDGMTNRANPVRVLNEQQINILVQFIRHWENYSTLP